MTSTAISGSTTSTNVFETHRSRHGWFQSRRLSVVTSPNHEFATRRHDVARDRMGLPQAPVDSGVAPTDNRPTFDRSASSGRSTATDPTRFDRLVRALTHAPTRRTALAALRHGFRAAAPSQAITAADGQRLLSSHSSALTHGGVDLSDTVTRFEFTSCDAAYNRCAEQAQFQYDLASFQCRLRGSQSCATAAQAHLTRELARCAAQFVCPPDHCHLDRVVGFEAQCCPNQEACAGVCRPVCPAPKLRPINNVACQCVCDPLLQECQEVFGGLQRIRDPVTCQCRCLTDAEAPCSLIGGVRDPATCLCACLDPLVPCDGRCVNLETDLFNCGVCGTRCGPDQKCCDGVCTTLTSDEHCGDCNTNLQPPWTCCVAPGRTRGVPTRLGTTFDCTDCFDVCLAASGSPLPVGGPSPPPLPHSVRTTTCCPPDAAHPTPYCDPGISPQHCGVCDSAYACVGREICCGSKTIPYHCVDPITSNTDCGTCGNTCAAGRHCDGGACVCDTGRQPCGRTLPSGPENCCGSGPGQLCCPPDGCVDTRSNPKHCGNCATGCPSGKNCVNGSCVCPTGQVACGAGCCPPASSPTKTTCCSGTCVDLRTDPAHCGSCPNACPPGRTCCSGVCVDLQNDPNHCGACPTVCPPGRTCCSGTCVDLQTDRAHCGSCPNACPTGRTCCSGVCVDLQSDRTHCGSCTTVCSTGKTCCPPGRCVNLQTDAAHCGRCDWTCGPLTTCSQGRCVCQPGGNCLTALAYCGPPGATCICVANEFNGPVCVQDGICSNAVPCRSRSDCPTFQHICVHNTCCRPEPVCALPCT
jgi:hypothetical protein